MQMSMCDENDLRNELNSVDLYTLSIPGEVINKTMQVHIKCLVRQLKGLLWFITNWVLFRSYSIISVSNNTFVHTKLFSVISSGNIRLSLKQVQLSKKDKNSQMIMGIKLKHIFKTVVQIM